MSQRSAIVIGAGIVGLAMARALARKQIGVKVFERNFTAIGASVRNFGMVWPIGQPAGKLYERAIISRNIWKEIGSSGAFWFQEAGSLHVAHQPEEWEVLQELHEIYKHDRKLELLSAAQTLERSNAVVSKNLFGALYSATELIVDPREAIARLPHYMSDHMKVEFHWGKCVSHTAGNTVYIGNEEEYQADHIFICSGIDLETLYPEHFAKYALTKCKLQMMRYASQPGNWRIGPALCGGLSLIHYNSFKVAPSLDSLRMRYSHEMSEYIDWGIHVMVSQNQKGELTVGDSHEYGKVHDPFDKEKINRMITDYLKQFAQLKDWSIIETWNGVYAKLMDGESSLYFSPEPGIYAVNGLGGAGMTLSFGLAEELVRDL